MSADAGGASFSHGPGCCADYLTEMEAGDPVARYYTDYQTADGHVRCLVHSNRLLVVSLGPRHPALVAGAAAVASVDFGFRAESRVSGKRKRGAQSLCRGGPLCQLTLAEPGEQPPPQPLQVRCPVKARLIEVNPRLAAEPGLAGSRPLTEGYLCILAPKLTDWPQLLDQLVKCSAGTAAAAATDVDE